MILQIIFVVPAFVFLFRMQDRSVEKFLFYLPIPKAKQLGFLFFRTYVATGYSQRAILPALFRARVFGPFGNYTLYIIC